MVPNYSQRNSRNIRQVSQQKFADPYRGQDSRVNVYYKRQVHLQLLINVFWFRHPVSLFQPVGDFVAVYSWIWRSTCCLKGNRKKNYVLQQQQQLSLFTLEIKGTMTLGFCSFFVIIITVLIVNVLISFMHKMPPSPQ